MTQNNNFSVFVPLLKNEAGKVSFIHFCDHFSSGEGCRSSSPGGLERHHGRQQSQTVLLVDPEDRSK